MTAANESRLLLCWKQTLVLLGVMVALFSAAIYERYRLYEAHHLVLLFLIYAAFALFVFTCSELILAAPGPTRWLAALLLTITILAQLRYQTDFIWFFQKPALSFGSGFLLWISFFLSSRGRRVRIGVWPALAVALGAGVAFVAITMASAFASETMRWHLIRHNGMIGTLLHHAGVAPSIGIEESLAEIEVEPQPASPEAVEAGEPDETPQDGRRRNVVFILVDTWRADSLGPYGGGFELMPRLSRLASRSYSFTNVWANASWTRPSVASFFTGLLPEQTGVLLETDALGPHFQTIAEIYRDRGYRTAAFVTNSHVGSSVGFAQGFEVFEEFEDAVHYARAGEVREAVVDWLAQDDARGRGLFLYIHLLDPHTPYLSGGARAVGPKHSDRAYRRELAYVDEQVASLIVETRALLGPDTIVVLTSDHGEEFGDHGGYGHGHSLYRELLWIPLVLDLGDGEGALLNEELDSRDVFVLLRALASSSPKVGEWARAARRQQRYASSYAQPSAGWVDRLVFPFRAQRLRAIEEDGQFLVWSGHGSTFELYDSRRDPLQLSNIASEHQHLVSELGRRLDSVVGYRTIAPAAEPSDADLERLKALGYVEELQ